MLDVQILKTIAMSLPWSMLHLPTKFHEGIMNSTCVFLLTDKLTKKHDLSMLAEVTRHPKHCARCEQAHHGIGGYCFSLVSVGAGHGELHG